MDALRRFLAILGADLRQRSRSPKFWIVLLAVGAASWWSFPPVTADYLTVSVANGERGRYSSAWIGLVLAMVHGVMLSLAGFYLVRGTLARDLETRVWQLLVATPMTRRGFLLAKWASHLVVMGLMLGAGVLVGLVAQWLRAEDARLDLVELIKPLVVLTLPSLALTCALAIWFDLVPGLRRSAGNVLFFVIWMTMTGVGISQWDPRENPESRGSWMSDPNGVSLVMRDLTRLRPPQAEDVGFSLNVGSQALEGRAPELFDWTVWPMQARDLGGRLVWFGLALGLVLAAVPVLDRFAARSSAETVRARLGGRRLRWLDRLLAPLRALPLGALMAVELLQVLRRRAWWWWIAALVFAGMQLFAPEKGLQVAVIGAWVLWLDVFSRLALRETEHGTAALVLSAPGMRWRLLAARLATALLLGWGAVLPALLRTAGSDTMVFQALLAAGASLALWGLALAVCLRVSRPFELVLLMLAYVGLQDGGPLALVTAPQWALGVHLLGLAPAIALLALGWIRMTAPERGRRGELTPTRLEAGAA